MIARVQEKKPDVVEIANCGGIGPALRDSLLLRRLSARRIPTLLSFHTGRYPALFQRRGLEAKLVRVASGLATCTVVLDAKSEAVFKALPTRPWIERRDNFVDVERIVTASEIGAQHETECESSLWLDGRGKGHL